MLALAEKSLHKNLKVAVGLMCRHCTARQELYDRIKGGQIGDIVALRTYRQTGPVGSIPVPPKPNDISELYYQIRMFHGRATKDRQCCSSSGSGSRPNLLKEEGTVFMPVPSPPS
ncbi:MAG: hypothetical protein ACLP7Q_12660, partial [Isosphaeraceae bacterium]